MNGITLDAVLDGSAPLRAVRPVVSVGWRSPERTWTFDLDAIEQACTYELGLELPVVLTHINGRRATDGRARFIDGCHALRVCWRLSPEQASRTLWHELKHAQQLERFPTPDAFWGAYVAAGVKPHAVYLANPYEVEARAAEREHERLALVI